MPEKNNGEKTILVNTENHRKLFNLKMDNKEMKSLNDAIGFLLKKVEELKEELEEKNKEIEELKKHVSLEK